MKIKVLYEDKDILAVDKPSGLLVHRTKGEGRDYSGNIPQKYPKLEIVHRLDRDTSGVILLAKNKKPISFEKPVCKQGKKIYHAIVSGEIRKIMRLSTSRSGESEILEDG